MERKGAKRAAGKEGTASTNHPKGREDLIHAHRERRETEPAAAPQVTDEETGDPSAPEMEAVRDRDRKEGPVPRKEPVRTFGVNTGEAAR
ncbi:hypothetical protein P6F26_05130, partial [Roseibacterium sp. SDUM158017]|nr:hypothetical protein [Roseibacterium sp. SDUM158017]